MGFFFLSYSVVIVIEFTFHVSHHSKYVYIRNVSFCSEFLLNERPSCFKFDQNETSKKKN